MKRAPGGLVEVFTRFHLMKSLLALTTTSNELHVKDTSPSAHNEMMR